MEKPHLQPALDSKINRSYLAEGPLADQGVDLVAVEPPFTGAYDVVVVGIVVAVVEAVGRDDLVLLVAAVLSLHCALGSPLLLGVVNLNRDVSMNNTASCGPAR